MKKLLLVIFSFCSVTHAQYEVASLLTVTKKDKAVFVRSLSQIGIRGNETRVLRAYLLSEVICKVQSATAEAYCRDLRRHEDLDGQTIADLSVFSTNRENLEVILNALKGIFAGVSYSLSPDGIQSAQKMVQLINTVLIAKPSPEVGVPSLLTALEQSLPLLSEISQTQSLQSYVSLLQQIPAWLKMKPTSSSMAVKSWRFSVRGTTAQCVLDFKDDFKCWETQFPFRDLASPLRGMARPVRLTKAANDSSCAFLETGDVACWGTSYLGRDPAKNFKACSGPLVESKTILIQDSRLAGLAKKAANLQCAGMNWSALFDGNSQLIDVIRTSNVADTDKRNFMHWIPSGAREISVYNGVVWYLSVEGELRSTSKVLPIAGLPNKDLEQIVTDGFSKFCVLKKKGGWACEAIETLAIPKKEADKKAQPNNKPQWEEVKRRFVFEFPRGEMQMDAGLHVLTGDRVYYATIHPEAAGGLKPVLRNFAKPQGVTEILFNDSLYDEQYDWNQITDKKYIVCPNRDGWAHCQTGDRGELLIRWQPKDQYYCYIEAGHVMCLERLSQTKVTSPFYRSFNDPRAPLVDRLILWKTDDVFENEKRTEVCGYSKTDLLCENKGHIENLDVYKGWDRSKRPVEGLLKRGIFSSAGRFCAEEKNAVSCMGYKYDAHLKGDDIFRNIDRGPFVRFLKNEEFNVEYRFGILGIHRFDDAPKVLYELDRRL